MVNVPKREDGMLDALLEYQQRIKSALQQLDLWEIAEPQSSAVINDIRETLKRHE